MHQSLSGLAYQASAFSKADTVLLLGRYRHACPNNFSKLQAAYPELSIRFLTILGSKGLEADHVVVLRATSDRMGLPSEIVDDPVLDMVMSEPGRFDHAEERRLFYVALTRARQSVSILADQHQQSVLFETWPKMRTTRVRLQARTSSSSRYPALRGPLRCPFRTCLMAAGDGAE